MILATLSYVKQNGKTLMVHRNKLRYSRFNNVVNDCTFKQHCTWQCCLKVQRNFLRHAKAQLRIQRCPSVVVLREVVGVGQQFHRDPRLLQQTVQLPRGTRLQTDRGDDLLVRSWSSTRIHTLDDHPKVAWNGSRMIS